MLVGGNLEVVQDPETEMRRYFDKVTKKRWIFSQRDELTYTALANEFM